MRCSESTCAFCKFRAKVADERMYVPFANIGLPLQPRFRTVRKIDRSADRELGFAGAQA